MIPPEILEEGKAGLQRVLTETAAGLGRTLGKLRSEGFRLPSALEVPPPANPDMSALQLQDELLVWLYQILCEALTWTRGDAKRLAETSSAMVMMNALYELRRAMLIGVRAESVEEEAAARGLTACAGVAYGIAAMRLEAEGWTDAQHPTAQALKEAEAKISKLTAGLAAGNQKKSANKELWQKRVRTWTSPSEFDWSRSNAAIAIAFRLANAGAGAPNSAELDRYIGSLRPH